MVCVHFNTAKGKENHCYVFFHFIQGFCVHLNIKLAGRRRRGNAKPNTNPN